MLCEGEIEENLLCIIAERLGVERARVHAGGLEQLHWSKAGRATVLVHLPGRVSRRSLAAPSLQEKELC